MADTTFNLVLPATKAVDLSDSTYALAVAIRAETAVPTNTVWEGRKSVDPPLKAVDLGDGTYAISAVVV